MATTGADIQATARELAGCQVDDVRYYTLPYGMTDAPMWDRDVAHTLDYGIDLVTSGGTIGVTWSQYGAFGYGLHLVHGPLLTGLSRAEFCSVADRPPWGAVLGADISGTRLHWLDVTWGNQETTGPVALSLLFAGSLTITLICGSWNGADNSVFPTGDDILVVWQPEMLPRIAPFLQADCPVLESGGGQAPLRY